MRTHTSLTVARFAVALGAVAVPACTTDVTTEAVQALQGSGPTAFVCLGSPSEPLSLVGRPLNECTGLRTSSTDFSIPHLYALVTQPVRGEVAVIDLTSDDTGLIDEDPATPGTGFLPIGASPTAIAATPGGMATFVAVAEPGFEGLFALPADRLRGAVEGVAARVSSWPSCARPEAPGQVAVVLDPADGAGRVRPSCDSPYGSDADSDAEDGATLCGPNATPHCHGDLANDAAATGKLGRYKLLVTLPSAGGFAVVDAQALLEQEPGAFEPCKIERFVPLGVDVPTLPGSDPGAGDGVSCTRDEPGGLESTSFVAVPAGIALTERSGGGSRLFIADRGAPVIHRVELPTPCEPSEGAPLLATSVEAPSRVVTTERISVSPRTFDLEQYLYAIDGDDGSIMVFDVTDGAVARTPLARPNPGNNPFQPADRVRLGAPPRDVVIVRASADKADPGTGALLPVRCDPSPNASSDAASYQTSASFTSGAGPGKLRGVFAFAVLVSGDVVLIDVDDLDARCRGPEEHHPLFGCGETQAGLTGASGEYSCNVVSRHEPRSSAYLVTKSEIANNEPGVATAPIAFDPDGALLDPDDIDAPRMRATVPTGAPPGEMSLVVGSERRALDPATGLYSGSADEAKSHSLVMNLETPRAHIVPQAWRVTYEGALPGFSGRFAALSKEAGGLVLRDASVRFCNQGVLGQNAVFDLLREKDGLTDADAATLAPGLADYVQLLGDVPISVDKYWTEEAACTYNACRQTYGTSSNPREARDYRILDARDDGLVVVPRAGAAPSPDVECCFPGVSSYGVRGGGQWIVVGDAVGFLHHVKADADGVCRPACDEPQVRLEGRVRATPMNTVVEDGAPGAFQNPFFRFAINATGTKRDTRFELTSQGAFEPLSLPLAPDGADVMPTAATFLDVTGELVISDGLFQGVSFIDVQSLARTRQYR